MGRIDYYHQDDAPAANSLVPGTSAIVVDAVGRILLQRRKDNSRWALPDGVMELGESIGRTVVREVEEETGLVVEPDHVVGVYSDPGHVFSYDYGEIRQEFSVCIACRVTGGWLRPGGEALEVRFFEVGALAAVDLHPSIRKRIDDYIMGRWAVVA
jgi:ADP-ribose pyrophosphatase YjhB (NUDIX family)